MSAVRTISQLDYDPASDVLTIEGVRYSGVLFRGLGMIRPSDRPFQIVAREDGVITLRDVHVGSEPEV